jgi:hypothetical protein
MPHDSDDQMKQPSSDPEMPVPAQPRQDKTKGAKPNAPPVTDEQIETDQLIEDRFEATDN